MCVCEEISLFVLIHISQSDLGKKAGGGKGKSACSASTIILILPHLNQHQDHAGKSQVVGVVVWERTHPVVLSRWRGPDLYPVTGRANF